MCKNLDCPRKNLINYASDLCPWFLYTHCLWLMKLDFLNKNISLFRSIGDEGEISDLVDCMNATLNLKSAGRPSKPSPSPSDNSPDQMPRRNSSSDLIEDGPTEKSEIFWCVFFLNWDLRLFPINDSTRIRQKPTINKISGMFFKFGVEKCNIYISYVCAVLNGGR